MGRLIDADKLSADMYHEAFEKDSDMQKWDSGCWIRYKMFENVLKAQPTVEPDTTTHDSIPAETGKNDGDRTSGDCISRTQAIDEIHEDAEWLASQGSDWQVERMERDKSILMSLPYVQPEINRSEFPNNSDTISRQALPYYIEPDGTLTITVPKGMKRIGRILIEEDGTQYGGLFYPDEE